MTEIVSDFSKNPRYMNCYETIYHYTSLEGLHGILTTNSLHFTNIYFLNDKTEMIYTYKLLLELIPQLETEVDNELLKSIKNRAEYVTCPEYYQAESEVLFRKDFYIASFSLEPDSLTLWNNYTKSNNKIGFNIKFQANDLVKHIKKTMKSPSIIYSKVCYKKDEQIKMLKESITKCNNTWIENPDKDERYNIIKDLWTNFIIYSLFFKHPMFETENEYRLIIGNISHSDDKKLEFRCQQGLFIPYLKMTLPEDKEVETRIIKEIKVSPTCDKSLIKYSIDKLLNKTGYRFTQISYSDIPLRY